MDQHLGACRADEGVVAVAEVIFGGAGRLRYGRAAAGLLGRLPRVLVIVDGQEQITLGLDSGADQNAPVRVGMEDLAALLQGTVQLEGR
ncbi:hypothetical protein [Streptomyces sp. NPDC051677]|uniref:hypothetical protein n=1 Tax=Streptomyces sp. NPDC051677 TaxID=3365669 RepID=UPI0037D45950